MMKPDLEVVDVSQHQSFKVWGHGYPFRTVRWHFHPEYEIQLITETSGQYFVGDYTDRFSPGNLVFMGPNLPHNWVSEVPAGSFIERRNLILQFPGEFLSKSILAFPEMRYLGKLADDSRRGVLFSSATGKAALPIMEELLTATHTRRIILFLSLLDLLVKDKSRKLLASPGFSPNPEDYMSSRINQVLAYIDLNLASELSEITMAEMTGQSISSFSRYFRKHTGLSFTRHVNNLRIQRACELLVGSQLSVADICFQVGYNNVSNFNRHFLAIKGIPPSRFRALYQLNLAQAVA